MQYWPNVKGIYFISSCSPALSHAVHIGAVLNESEILYTERKKDFETLRSCWMIGGSWTGGRAQKSVSNIDKECGRWRCHKCWCNFSSQIKALMLLSLLWLRDFFLLWSIPPPLTFLLFFLTLSTLHRLKDTDFPSLSLSICFRPVWAGLPSLVRSGLIQSSHVEDSLVHWLDSLLIHWVVWHACVLL